MLVEKIKKVLHIEENVPLPSVNFYIHINKLLKYTPDLAKLREKRAHYMFFPDDMKRGHRRHAMIKESSKFCAQGFTKSGFSMWRHNLGQESYPISFEDKDAFVPFLKLKGEVFLVPTDTIKILDEHRENGVQFLRKRVRISIPFRIQRMDRDAKVIHTSRTYEQHLSPWMYVGVNDHWVELLNGIQFSPVTQQYFGKEMESMKYYEFVYKDYFNEEVKTVKRNLIPIPKLDAYGNEIIEPPPPPPPLPEVKPSWWQTVQLQARKK